MMLNHNGSEPSTRQKLFVDNLPLNRIKVMANDVTNDLFYSIAHTPLPIFAFDAVKRILIVCLSNHDFIVGGNKLIKSGLVARNDINAAQNILEIINQHPSSVVLVSQLAKKYFDRETMMQEYKSRIFALLPYKTGITNKLPSKGMETISYRSL